jgi:hypothetical protein
MSILKNIGLFILGDSALAEIKNEVVELTTRTVLTTEARKVFTDRTSFGEREDFLQNELHETGRRRQVQAALLTQLTGSGDNAFTVADAARKAEESGEGFMKKKAAVLKVVKELGLSKSKSQLVIELAVQLIKD